MISLICFMSIKWNQSRNGLFIFAEVLVIVMGEAVLYALTAEGFMRNGQCGHGQHMSLSQFQIATNVCSVSLTDKLSLDECLHIGCFRAMHCVP